MLIRFDPFRDLDRVAQELRATAGAPSRIPMDAVRRGDLVELQLELPGVDPASIDVELEKHSLTVTAERSATDASREGEEVLVRERQSGRFARQVTLGDHLDPDQLEARYDHGVLTLTVPVAEQAKSRKVAVANGSPAAPIDAAAHDATAAHDAAAA